MSVAVETTGEGAFLSPLRLGLRFAVRYQGMLIALAVAPLLVKCGVAYVVSMYPLEDQQWFLVLVVLAAADAWLLSATGMLCIETLRGQEPPLGRLLSRAFQLLPKVFISYSLVLTLVTFSSSASPLLLLLVVFFFWAPSFVVGEFYAKETVKPLRKREIDFDDEDEEFEELDDEEEPPLFSEMSVWNLGFARSFRFTMRNLGTTLEFIVLYWCANVIPLAIVRFLLGPYQTPAGYLYEIILQSLSTVFVLSMSSRAFFHLLPREGREELELPAPGGQSKAQSNEGFQQHFFFLLLLSIALLSSWYLFMSLRQSQRMPTSTVSEPLSAVRKNDEIVVRFKLIDTRYNFRWLQPRNFRLALAGSPTKPGEEYQLSQNPLIPEKLADSSATRDSNIQIYVLEPEATIVMNQRGEKIGDRFRPSFEPLMFELRFRLLPSHPQARDLALIYAGYDEGGHESGERLYRIRPSELQESAQ